MTATDRNVERCIVDCRIQGGGAWPSEERVQVGVGAFGVEATVVCARRCAVHGFRWGDSRLLLRMDLR